MRAEVDSPTYHGGLWRKGRAALVDPARLAWGLKAAAEALGVRIYEHTKATKLEHDGIGVLVHTPFAKVRAGRVALGTNAFPPLLRRMRHYIVPVYDYAMVTEPLSPERLASVGWANRQGLSDYANQFHYYRLTEDNRILWGGYDAVYYFGGKVDPALEWRPETFARLSAALLHGLPPARGRRVHQRLGRRHRHLHALLRVLGHGHARQGRLRRGLHRPRRVLDALRGRGARRPARGPPDRAHRAGVRPQEAAAVPAGADQVRRHPADPLVARPGRPPRRPSQRLAPHARPPRPRLRQLDVSSPCLRRRSPLRFDRLLLACARQCVLPLAGGALRRPCLRRPLVSQRASGTRSRS